MKLAYTSQVYFRTKGNPFEICRLLIDKIALINQALLVETSWNQTHISLSKNGDVLYHMLKCPGRWLQATGQPITSVSLGLSLPTPTSGLFASFPGGLSAWGQQPLAAPGSHPTNIITPRGQSPPSQWLQQKSWFGLLVGVHHCGEGGVVSSWPGLDQPKARGWGQPYQN